MTADARISEDLAIVGRTSRARPIAIESTLRAVGAVEEPRTTNGPSFAAAHVYAARLARASAGMAAIASTAALVLYGQFYFDWNGQLLDLVYWMPKLWVVMCLACIVLAIHGGVARLAVGHVRDPDPHGRVARWSVGASIAGVMTVALYFGMMQVVLAGFSLAEMTPLAVREWPKIDLARLQWWTYVILACAVIASTLGAVLVARSRVRYRRWFLLVGTLVLAATITAGLLFDAGPLIDAEVPAEFPSISLRAVLTATGTVGLFLLVTGLVLRVHRGDDALLAR